VHHLWFPTYDPALQRYGPGTTLMIQTVRAAAEHPGLDTVDFGAGGEWEGVHAASAMLEA